MVRCSYSIHWTWCCRNHSSLVCQLTESSYCRHPVAWTEVARPRLCFCFRPSYSAMAAQKLPHARCRRSIFEILAIRIIGSRRAAIQSQGVLGGV